jgi:hypothetical protein
MDTSTPLGEAAIIADIEFDDDRDIRFHGSIRRFTQTSEPTTGQVSGVWYRLQRTNSLDLDIHLPLAPARLNIDVFSDEGGRLHGQWSIPHGIPEPIDAHIIFDSCPRIPPNPKTDPPAGATAE